MKTLFLSSVAYIRSKVERPRAQGFQKGLGPPLPHAGVVCASALTAMGPRALHALHTLLLRHYIS